MFVVLSLQQEEYILGVLTERACHTRYALKTERLNTFDHFYSDSCRTKDEFAEAGFFSTGTAEISNMHNNFAASSVILYVGF